MAKWLPASRQVCARPCSPRLGQASFGLFRDLHALKVLATDSAAANTAIAQAAQALRDSELMSACGFIEEQVKRQQSWLQTHLLHRAAHTLTVPS